MGIWGVWIEVGVGSLRFIALPCFLSYLCFLLCEDVSTQPYVPVATTWINSCQHALSSAMPSTFILKANRDAFSLKLPFADYNEKSNCWGGVLWTRPGRSQGTVRCQVIHPNRSTCQGASCLCHIVSASYACKPEGHTSPCK